MLYKKILIAIDGGHHANAVIETALELAKVTHAEIGLIHVLNPAIATVNLEVGMVNETMVQVMLKQGENIMNNAVKHCTGFTLTEFLPWGTPGTEILNVAQDWGADLIVLGTHAQTRLERFFMGSVAQHVVNRCSVSVLVVPERMEK